MEVNQSECEMTETQRRIATIIYSSFSFISFVIALIAVILNRCNHYICNQCSEIEPIQGIFAHVMTGSCTLELFESFQWLVLLNNSISCSVLGLIREYAILNMIIIVGCLGAHLIIIMKQPKWLQVIKEEKQKMYKKLQVAYIVASLVIPLLIIPWPFLTTGYGKDDYLCWLADTERCNASQDTIKYDITHLFMWHLWAVLLWIFTVGVVVFAFYKYCFKKSAAIRGSNQNHSIVSIVCLLVVYIITVAANVLAYLVAVISHRSSFQMALQAAVLTPLMIFALSFILLIQQAIEMVKSSQRVNTTMEKSCTTHGLSYGATETYFHIPGDAW